MGCGNSRHHAAGVAAPQGTTQDAELTRGPQAAAENTSHPTEPSSGKLGDKLMPSQKLPPPQPTMAVRDSKALNTANPGGTTGLGTPQPPNPWGRQGVVADKIKSIVERNDDVFGDDIVEDASTYRAVAKPGRRDRAPEIDSANPLSTSVEESELLEGLLNPGRNAANSSSQQQQQPFTDIAKRPGVLPPMPEVKNSWSGPTSGPSQGGEDEVLTITPHARTAIVPVTQSELIGVLEEDDVFDMNALAAPKFEERSRQPAQPTSRAPMMPEDDVLEIEPDDPWEKLQHQYRIRADMQSPSSGIAKKKPAAASEEELILDEDARVNMAAARSRARKESGRRQPAATRAAVAPPSSGPTRKEAGWGDGDMARAGDIMLGRGALDAGNGFYASTSNFSAEYVEYQGHEQSFDLDAIEAPNPADIAMEDFNEDTYGHSNHSGVKKSLEEKLRLFEAQFDDDDDDDLVNEELRLIASNKS